VKAQTFPFSCYRSAQIVQDPVAMDQCHTPRSHSGISVASTTTSEESFKYAGWHVQGGLAWKDHETIQLHPGRGVLAQGWWQQPEKDCETPHAILAGCCLFDYRWQMHFEKRGKGNPAACKPLPSAHSRRDIMERLKKGHKVVKIVTPTTLGDYHRKLIQWQVNTAAEMGVTDIFYHLPAEEYHFHIRQLEAAAGFQIPEQHEALDKFADMVLCHLKQNISSTLPHCRLHILEPMKFGIKDPDESYLWPYINIRSLTQSPVVALEDLPEVHLAKLASQRSGEKINVLCVILDSSDPYKCIGAL